MTANGAERWRRVRQLFQEALDLGPQERDVYLSRECDNDSVRSAGLEVGPYRLEKRLGHGGMGIVYLARRIDEEFQQRVAIKLRRRTLGRSSPTQHKPTAFAPVG